MSLDFILNFLTIFLFCLQFLSFEPIVMGFLRIRAAFKIPMAYILISTAFDKKVSVSKSWDKVKPINTGKEKFKTYKEKLLFILETYCEEMDQPSDLIWCIHVVKNDFL